MQEDFSQHIKQIVIDLNQVLLGLTIYLSHGDSGWDSQQPVFEKMISNGSGDIDPRRRRCCVQYKLLDLLTAVIYVEDC